jgi:hypothetical protein
LIQRARVRVRVREVFVFGTYGIVGSYVLEVFLVLFVVLYLSFGIYQIVLHKTLSNILGPGGYVGFEVYHRTLPG